MNGNHQPSNLTKKDVCSARNTLKVLADSDSQFDAEYTKIARDEYETLVKILQSDEAHLTPQSRQIEEDIRATQPLD